MSNNNNSQEKKIPCRVANIESDLEHTSEQEIIDALNHRSITRWAYILHDKDVYTESEEKKGKGKAGFPKSKHWHIVCELPNNPDVRTVAKWFNLDMNFIDIPKGRGSFLDCVEYLTHEKDSMKHRYKDEEVKSNFDWRKALEDRENDLLKYGKHLDPDDKMCQDVLYYGKTLKMCREEDHILYQKLLERLKKYRLDYIYNQKVPSTRLNYYITGASGEGKTVASRALARVLFPQIEDDEDIFFEVGSKNATFEGYDGQPVIIWSEFRALTLLDAFGGRENLFKVFDSHPENSRVNIKYGSVKLTNVVNIVNSIQPYKEFLDGLAGEYVDRSGNLFTAEDKGQSYRRFPIIIPLHADELDILLNTYFTGESNNPCEYMIWRSIVGNFKKVRQICKNNEQLARSYESNLFKGLPEKSQELLANEQELTDDEIREALKDFGKEVERPSGVVREERIDCSTDTPVSLIDWAQENSDSTAVPPLPEKNPLEEIIEMNPEQTITYATDEDVKGFDDLKNITPEDLSSTQIDVDDFFS